jgi:hypothetical protein
VQGPPEFSWARSRLFSAFKGNWAALAQSRFACWTVTKMFAAVDLNKKVPTRDRACLLWQGVFDREGDGSRHQRAPVLTALALVCRVCVCRRRSRRSWRPDIDCCQRHPVDRMSWWRAESSTFVVTSSRGSPT